MSTTELAEFDQTRRTLYVDDREIPMRSGCAPDLSAYAAVLDVPFRVEEPARPPARRSVLMPQERLRSTTGIHPVPRHPTTPDRNMT